MNNEISYKRIARTEDTDDSVILIEHKDSYMVVILDSSNNSVNVYVVKSEEKGDMKYMLDDLMGSLSTDKVYFLWPIQGEDKEKANKIYEKFDVDPMSSQDLEDVLEGFEEKWVNWNGQDVHVLEGTWKTG